MNYEFVKMYKHCQFKWYLKYGIDEDNELSDDELINQLLIDTIEFGIEKATQIYYDKYPIINNFHIEEVIKVEFLENRFEYPKGITKINWRGVDLVVRNKDNTHDLYEVVYSEVKYGEKFKPTDKLSILKHQLKDQLNIKNLKVVHFPKLNLKQLNNESTLEFRKRLMFNLDLYRPKIYDVDYNQLEVDDYLSVVQAIEENDGSNLEKNIGFHCYSCKYENICKRSR